MNAQQLLTAFSHRLAQRDADGCALLFTPDATYEEPPHPMLTGRDAIRDFVADFLATHTNVAFPMQRICIAANGECAASEWRFTYTRNVDGSPGGFEGMSIIEIRDGQIASWRGFSARLTF